MAVLNRLYIVIGVLAILVLSAGFVLPRAIDWSGYRGRLEALAEASLGTDIIIGGEIDFVLLPYPQIRFGQTIVGPALSPLVEIKSVVADFSLIDFLRDQFVITKLVLDEPVINLVVDREGDFQIPLEFPATIGERKVSIASADIINGVFRFADQRADQSWSFNTFNGELDISDLRGPFSLKGTGDIDGRLHFLRLNVSALNQNQQTQASFFWRPDDGFYSVAGEGMLSLTTHPEFNGDVIFKSSPISSQQGDQSVEAQVVGDFVFTSQVELSPNKFLFSAFEMQPDENQAGSRLTGAAVVHLGELQNFDVVVSGGVISVVPGDIRHEELNEPYGMIQLLNQIPAPLLPPMAGRIGIDVSELKLRDFSLRNVRLDASSDGDSWMLDNLVANLPGDTRIHLSGGVVNNNGAFGYRGIVELQTRRMGTFARLWKRVERDSSLHNVHGALRANVSFENSVLGISEGKLTLDDIIHEFAGQFVVSADRSALLGVRVAPVNAAQSRTLFSLLPDFSSGGVFVRSFPSGSVDVFAEHATLFEMDGQGMSLQLDWDASGIHVERLSAVDLGGAQLALTGDIRGNFAQPLILGGGRITLGLAAKEAFLPVFLHQTGAPVEFGNWVGRSLPADFNVDVGPVEQNGGQMLSALGRAGFADFELDLHMENGLGSLVTAPFNISALLHAENADEFNEQLGLGPVSLLADGAPLSIAIEAQGAIPTGVEVDIDAKAGTDHLGYTGMVNLSDLSGFYGHGTLEFALVDFSPLLELAGAQGIHVPGGRGSVDVSVSSKDVMNFENLAVTVAGSEEDNLLNGDFRVSHEAGQQIITGQFNTASFDVEQLVSLASGASAFIRGEEFWAVGPIDLGNARRQSRGRIGFSSPRISTGDFTLATQTSFEFVWDESSVSLENIRGMNGEGEIAGSLNFCCTALTGQSQLSGRFTLSEVLVAGIFPTAISEGLGGIIDAGIQFETSGSSFQEMAGVLSGEGSFSLVNASISHFDPAAFETLTSLDNIVDMDADILSTLMEVALDRGSFETDQISSVFQIAGGKLRAGNIAVSGDEARLLGGVRVDLSDMSLTGSWIFTPTELGENAGLIDENNVRVGVALGGTLLAPTRKLDLGQMIDAIKVRALEIELERLEVLRAEQVARSRAAAFERARLMELEAERLAAEAARVAAEEERRRLADAAAEEAARLAGEQQPLVFDVESEDPLLFSLPPENLLGE